MKRTLMLGGKRFHIVRQNELKVEISDADGDRFLILKTRIRKEQYQ